MRRAFDSGYKLVTARRAGGVRAEERNTKLKAFYVSVA